MDRELFEQQVPSEEPSPVRGLKRNISSCNSSCSSSPATSPRACEFKRELQHHEPQQEPQPQQSPAHSDAAALMAVYGAGKRRVYLNVAHAHIEDARAAGAKFDSAAGRFFVGAGMNLQPFQQWLPCASVLCSGHQQPAICANFGGQTRAYVCSQRFCCDFLQLADEDASDDEQQQQPHQQQQPSPVTFAQLIHGYQPKPGTAGLTSYCWSYLQDGKCCNVSQGMCCCLKHATAKTSASFNSSKRAKKL